MSKQQFDTHLKYGQGILIKGYKQSSNGIMTTKGFADTRARFQTYDDILYFKNYRNAIFQVLPATSFDNNDQLRYLIENNIQTQSSNMEILTAKAKSENDQFDHTIKTKDKLPVCFGDQVVLKHIDSGTFLSGTIRPAEGKNGAFSVEVTNNLKDSLIFRLLPYRSFENQPNPIPLESPILIENVSNKGFLTFQRYVQSQKKQKLNLQKSPIKSDDSYKIPVKTDSTNSEIFQCVTHFCDLSIEQSHQKMPWKFQLHFNDVDNDNLIQHDIVYFQHTLNNGVLAAAVDQEIVLKELKGEKTSQLSFYDCLWEIQQYKQRGDDCYILRHLMSGMTLGVDYIKVNDELIPLKPKLIDISDGKGNENEGQKLGYIQLKLAKKQGGDIVSRSYINIRYGQKCLDVAKEKERQFSKRQAENKALFESQIPRYESKDGSHVDLVKMANMASNQFCFQIKKLQFTDNISKHCFVIQEIDNTLKSEVLFALSFHSRLINLREDLKWGAQQSEKKVTYIRMMQITEKTKQIKYFLKNTTSDDPNRQFKRPLPKRQIICFHLGISQLLFQLLYFLKKNRNGEQGLKEGKPVMGRKIFENEPNQMEKFIEMYNAIYEVIFELIRDNLQFKIHVSKWINFILEDVIEYDQQYQLKTLLQLLKNNSFFVNNFVTEQLITYLVDRMIKISIQTRNPQFIEKKYIEIFRAFCICGDQVNSDNQVHILNKFIKRLSQDQEANKFQIKLSKKKNEEDGTEEIGCTAAFDKNKAKWRKFNDYYKMCRDEYPSAWRYMVCYLNLIADLCRGRNKVVESYIDTTISLEVLTQLLTKQKLFDAEVPIIRIAHYLYAESENFYPIDKITRVIDYGKLDEPIKMNSTKSDVRPKLFLGKIMDSLVDKLQTYKTIQIKNVGNNECLYVILDFLKETFILGFWEERKQIESIYESISGLIIPQPSINYEEIKYQSQKPQIVLMVSCKQKCLEILQLIIDLDIDFYLKHLAKTFKKYEIPQTNRSIELQQFLKVSEDNRFSVDFFNQYLSQNKQLTQIISLSICPKIIELAKHSQPKLTGLSLKILQRLLDFYRHIMTGFMNMIFICEESRIELHKFISDRRDKFFTLEYQTTTKTSLNNQKSLYFMMYRDEKDAGIMQDLFMISQLVKNEHSLARIRDIKTLDSSGTFKELAEQKLINFTSERRSSNKMKQKVVDSADIHNKVLKYIMNCKQIPTESLALKLLHLCYRFLVSIIQNNQQLKQTLVQYIPKMINHINKNIGCIDFFKQMYDNNKNMLYNQGETLKLIKVVCSSIEEENKYTSYYKSKLLDFFRYLIYCNGRAFTYNQIQILKIMQDDSYKNIIFDITPEEIARLVAEYTEKYSFQPPQGSNKAVKMSPELTYTVTFFQILVSLIDGQCKVNAGKLVKKFPFEKLVECIRVSQRCWPLKRNLRAFLNRLYYFQPEIETYISIIRTQQIQNIIKDLNWYIQIKFKGNVSKFQMEYFQNPVRFSYLESYLYLNLEENLLTLYKIMKSNQLINQFKNFLHSAKNSSMVGPYNFIRICQRLGCIRNYFADKQNIFSTSYIKYLLSKLRLIIEEFDDNIYSKGMMFGGDRVPTKQQKDKSRKMVIEKIMMGEITSFFIQGAQQINKELPLVYQTPPKILINKQTKPQNRDKLIKKLRQILTRTKRYYDNKDDEIEDKQSKMICALKLSKQLNEQLQGISNQSLNRIILDTKAAMLNQKVSQKQKQGVKNEPGKYEDVHVSQFDSLLQYVTSIIEINSTNPEAFSPELKIFFLNLIIGVIQQSNKTKLQEKKAIDEWEGEDWVNSANEIQKIQIKLKNGHLGNLIAEILKQNIMQNISLANSTILCGIAFMLGGNQVTQRSIIQQIKKDPDNRVLRNLYNLITKLGKIILKNVDQRNLKPVDSEEFQPDRIDNYDFYDQKQKYCLRKNVIQRGSTNQVIYYRDCVVTYRRAFRFLQLLCQNNNIDNKNYIRDQPGMMQPVDFINLATNELRNLFISMCADIVDVPEFLLDFLIEVTQIPVKQNQQTLLNSSFFEDLCQMSSQFSKQNKLKEKGFEDTPNPFNTIYRKSVQIILSIFEGNDKSSFSTLDTNLDPKFLVNIVENKLKMIGVTNKKSLLLYIKGALEKVNQKGEKEVQPFFNQELLSIFDILIIFKKFQENLNNSRTYGSYEKFKNDNQDRQQIFAHLEKSLINIEIKDGNQQKQTIYFAKHPFFYSLSENMRDSVMDQVKRDTHRDKIVSLIGYTDSIKQSLQYSFTLEKSQKIVESNMVNSYYAASFFSCVICVFLICFYGVIIEYGDADFTSTKVYKIIAFVLSLMQLSMSICYAYFWMKLKIWYKPQSKPKQTKKKKASNEEKKQVFYNNLNFLKLLLFVGVSFYGTFFNPTFFFIHIIDIFCNSPQLANIFKAIAQTFKPLGYVSFMGVIFVVVFCTVTFNDYTKDVYKQKQIIKGTSVCSDMTNCLLDLYVSGAIGQTMSTFSNWRFTYDIIYATFFGVLFGNIVSGIMLDAFGALRQKNEELKSDKQNMCYICNIERESLEKKNEKFKDHITKKHFLWNYVFYIISLNSKNKTDYSGLEYQIYTQYNQSDEDMKIDWIPDGEEADYDPTEDVKGMVEKVDKFNEYCENSLGQLEGSIKQFNQSAGELEAE